MQIKSNINKFKHIKLIKRGLGVGIIATSLLLGGCGTNNTYYLVKENGQSYICTRTEKYVNYDDYDFISITSDKVIGSICSNRKSFDYNNHRLATRFLNELQVIPLKDAFAEQNINDAILNDENQLINLAKSNSLDNIAINHFTQMKYEINKRFIYSEPSKLELFVTDDNVIIGYDISPDKDFNKHQYIYSISDMDVIQYSKNDNVQNITIGLYLTEEQQKRGYLTYNEAIDMVNKYMKFHHKQLIK